MKFNEIKQIDIGGTFLRDYVPEDESCFFEWVTVSLGVKGEEGGANYNLMVCTPDWLKLQLEKQVSEWGRHKLIIKKYDPKIIENEIEKLLGTLLTQYPGDDDVGFSQKVGRYIHWEFEDYQL